MNLDYGPEYEEFRKQVKDFCKKYQGLVFSDSYGPRLGGDKKSENSNGSVSYTHLTLPTKCSV